MPSNRFGNLPLAAIVIGSLVVNISGFGEHSPLMRLSAVAVAMATWVTIELYTKQIHRLADAWEQFMLPAMAKTRTVVSGVMLFTAAYILVSSYLSSHGDQMPQTTGNAVTLGIGLLSLIWFFLEMVTLKQNLDYCRPAATSPVPDSFPSGYLFPNLQRLAGPGASAEQLLAVAQAYSVDQDWLLMCRHVIAKNMPDSALAMIGTVQVGLFGDDVWIQRGDEGSRELYDRLVRASGVPHPDRQVLMGVAHTYFEHPDDLARCLNAIRDHHVPALEFVAA